MTSKTNAAASGTVSRFGAKYDALGRRIETSRSGSAFAQNFVSDYQYDLLGQLTKDERFAGETPGDPAAKLEAQSFGFLYDGIGNRLTAQKGNDTTAYTPNALNQYTDIDGIEPVYDADGNLFSDGKNRFHWDAENRLTLVEPLVPTEGSQRLEFKYDYIGRRVSKQVWTHTGGSWTDESTTAFVYDGWNLIEEVATSSQTASINHYTWGLDLSGSLQGAGGVGGLLSVVCASFSESGLIGDWLLPIGYVSGPAPSTFYYTFDLNGNVSELLDSTGSIAAHYEYGPFGEMLRETYPSSALSEVERSLLTFNFSTKYYDAELKTLYYGYRYYDPTNGRWLNRDPIAEQGGLNLYGFVGNDAVNRWDLWGMKGRGRDDEEFLWRGTGHHPVPVSEAVGWPKASKKVFDEAAFSAVDHRWEVAHVRYNAEVSAEMAEFFAENNYDLVKISNLPEHEQRRIAKEFVDRVDLNSSNQFIREYNDVTQKGRAEVERWYKSCGHKIVLKSTGDIAKNYRKAKVITGMAKVGKGVFNVVGKRIAIVSTVIIISSGIANGKSISDIGSEIYASISNADFALDMITGSGLYRSGEMVILEWHDELGMGATYESFVDGFDDSMDL
ncbi:MAG: RHS repeat-associated core domain-containing protein [Opitutales bacterium]|nr:RHS repeat-associated core domain-containing protein [Opitutales bacterium]